MRIAEQMLGSLMQRNKRNFFGSFISVSYQSTGNTDGRCLNAYLSRCRHAQLCKETRQLAARNPTERYEITT